MTLPLIYMLNISDYSEKRKAINIVKNHHNNPQKVAELIEKVNISGGIEYSKNKMEDYKNKALAILAEMPESESKTAMEKLVIFTINRNK